MSSLYKSALSSLYVKCTGPALQPTASLLYALLARIKAQHSEFTLPNGPLPAVTKLYNYEGARLASFSVRPLSQLTPVLSCTVQRISLSLSFRISLTFFLQGVNGQTWPHGPNFAARPSSLAASGFYYDPRPVTDAEGDITGLDRAVCYSCHLALSAFEPVRVVSFQPSEITTLKHASTLAIYI